MTEYYDENGRDQELTAPKCDEEKTTHEMTDHEHGRDHAPMAVKSKPAFESTDVTELERYGNAFDLIPLRRHDKRPLEEAWPDSSHDLASMRAHMRNGCNVGVNLNSNDRIIIDVDPRAFEIDDDEVIIDSFEKLLDDFGLRDRIAQWPCVVTGGGGRHYYLRKPRDLKLAEKISGYPGVEFKGSKGRQVVAAGSVHPETGRVYRWDLEGGRDFSAELPQCLIEALTRRGKQNAGTRVKAETVAWQNDAKAKGIFEPELVEQLLDTLDPVEFQEYDDWIKIGMACHHASDGHAWSEFLSWSVDDPEYSGREEEIERHWQSFGTSKRDVKLVTYRSLLKSVEEYGGKGKEKALDAARHAVACADFEDEVLDWTPPKPSGPETVAQEQARLLASLNGEFFTVLRAGKYAVGWQRKNKMYGHDEVQFYSESAIRKHLDRNTVRVEKDGDVKRVPLGKWFLAHPGRRHYDDIVFDPMPGAVHDATLNLWSGWSVDPVEGDWEPFRRLILDVLCSGDLEAYHYVLNWCARMVQRPHLPGEVVLAFVGAKRTGKGTFGRAMTQLAAPNGVHVIQQSQLTGKFNAHLAMKIALFADEAFFTGDPQQASTMKGLATEDSFLAEPKGVDAFRVPNMLHIVMASNSEWVVSADQEEQRFAVFRVKAENAKQFKRDIGYGVLFDERGQVKASILSAFLHEMLQRDIAGWRPQEHIPETEGLVEQRLETLLQDPRVRWWYRCLTRVVPGHDRMSRGWQHRELIAGPFLKQEFYREYQEMIEELPYVRKRHKLEALAKWLRATFGYGMDARAENNRKAWLLPPLDQCRRDFEQVFKVGSIDWEEAEAEYY